LQLRTLFNGTEYEICDVFIQSRSLVEEFIDALSTPEQKKIVALLERTANEGLPLNREKFKKLEDGIFEFKSFQVRILCTILGKKIILTHGVLKKKDRHDPESIEKARRLLHDAGVKQLRLMTNAGTKENNKWRKK